MIICDYCASVATRVDQDGSPVCSDYAREQYGSDWRTVTRTLGKRETARLTADAR